MFDTSKLSQLVIFLERRHDVSLAQARAHTHAGEHDEASKEQRRAERCKAFAADVQAAIGYIRKKDKRKAGCIAPTWEEVKMYAVLIGWPERDAKMWFNHFQANGWKVGGKSPMKDWQAAADNGFEHWKEKHPEQVKRLAKPGANDPVGWAEFLKSIERPYVEFRFAMDHIKSEFNRQRRK